MADKNPDNELLDEVTGKPLPDAEVIARRSADIETKKAKGNEHVKVITVGPMDKPTEKTYDFESDKAAVRQYAISGGMRPVGDVTVSSIEKREGTTNVWDITYTLPVAVDERLEQASEPDIVSDGPGKKTTD